MYVDTDILSEHWNTNSLLSFASDVQGGILHLVGYISLAVTLNISYNRLLGLYC